MYMGPVQRPGTYTLNFAQNLKFIFVNNFGVDKFIISYMIMTCQETGLVNLKKLISHR